MRHHRLSITLAFVLCTTLALASGVFAGEKKITRKDLPLVVLAAFEKAYPRAVIKGLSKEVRRAQRYTRSKASMGRPIGISSMVLTVPSCRSKKP